MRELNEVIVHCADTRIDQNFDVNDVKSWHLNNGWSDIGYHYYIKLDGTIQKGRDINISGAHCKGRNSNSIGICFEGGKKEDGTKWDSATYEQIQSFNSLFYALEDVFCIKLKLSAHYEYSSKTCPNFKKEILL